jgi:hypothetical protein
MKRVGIIFCNQDRPLRRHLLHRRLVLRMSTRTINIYVYLCIMMAHFTRGKIFPQKKNFVKCDWPTQIFCRKNNFEAENFQLLTMIFSVEMGQDSQ